MKLDEKIVGRLNDLISDASVLLEGRVKSGGQPIRQTGLRGGSRIMGYTPVSVNVNREHCNQWGISCLYIIKRIFADSSDHYQKFNELFPKLDRGNNVQPVKSALGILKAAKDDYEKGYLFDTRTLIEAEVFDDFLEQAEELFNKGYYQAAAVITGCVLEDGLRKLCDRNSIALPAKATIEPMNVELAKAGIYTKLVQKKITALADLRNKAAHGEWTEFTEKDVEDMIRDVRRFMEDYFS
ncbi:MAG: HEPN domain-containing protein [Pyrinomonadaceae bacterium]